MSHAIGRSQLMMNVGEGLSIALGSQGVAVWDNTSRPQNPIRGEFGYNSETSTLEYFDGHDWYGAELAKA